jgi:hypothetical protein
VKLKFHAGPCNKAAALARWRHCVTAPDPPSGRRHVSAPRRMAALEPLFDTLHEVTQVPRRVQLQPRSLTAEQLAADPTVPAEPVPVRAWVIWEDGVEEQVTGQAVAWTPARRSSALGTPPAPERDLGLGCRGGSELNAPSPG